MFLYSINASLIQFIAYFFVANVPIVIFQIGNFMLNPLLTFSVTILVSITLYFIDIKLWKLFNYYIHYVARKKEELYNEFL